MLSRCACSFLVAWLLVGTVVTPVAATTRAALLQDDEEFHKPNRKLIVGGTPTTPESHPYLVRFFKSWGPNARDMHRCAGTLLTPTVVLSAAHCFCDTLGTQASHCSTSRIVARLVTSENGTAPGVGGAGAVQLLGVVLHPDWNYSLASGLDMTADLALAVLATPAEPLAAASGISATAAASDTDGAGAVSSAGQPFVELASLDELAAALPPSGAGEVLVLGWGDTDSGCEDGENSADGGDPGLLGSAGVGDGVGGEAEDRLRGVHVPLASDGRCSALLSAAGTEFNASAQFCAVVEEGGGRDHCRGDSGGPAMLHVGGGRLKQVGVVSGSATGCGLPESPGYYTRLATYLGWVQDTAAAIAQDPYSVPLVKSP